jgi:hypothetical protein
MQLLIEPNNVYLNNRSVFVFPENGSERVLVCTAAEGTWSKAPYVEDETYRFECTLYEAQGRWWLKRSQFTKIGYEEHQVDTLFISDNGGQSWGLALNDSPAPKARTS